MPMNNPSAVSGTGDRGIFADSTTLQTAYPAAGSAGWTASVGASAPYARYYCNGIAWAATGGSGSPGGSTTQVQFNDAGAFAGAAGMTWDKTNNVLAIAAGTATTAVSPLAITQTWNNAAINFPGIDFNATGTAYNTTSTNFLNLRLSGSSIFRVSYSGQVVANSTISAFSYIATSAGISILKGGVWADDANAEFILGASADVRLRRAGAASIQLGAANAASPVAQTLTTQAPRGGTDSNTAGVSFKISAGPSTGTATPNKIILQSTVVAASGTTAQTQLDTLIVTNGCTRGRAVTFATLPASPTQGDECYITDALAPAWNTALAGGGAVLCGARYNGSTWVAF